MPSINIKQEVYGELYKLMALELQKKVSASSNNKQAMEEIIKNKFGITFNGMILTMLNEYKKNHKIK